MIFDSYKNLGNLNFDDDYITIKEKILNDEFIERDEDFIGDIRKIILLNNADIKIVFKGDNKSIDFFELFGGSLIFKNKDLFKLSFDELLNHLNEYDSEIEFEEDEIVSRKFGLQITKKIHDDEYLDIIDNILLFSRDYLDQYKPSGDDILKYYLGYNPFEDDKPDSADL